MFDEGAQARVLADLEAAAEGVLAESIDGQRYQLVAFQAQQGGSIARQQAAKGFEQAAVAFAVR